MEATAWSNNSMAEEWEDGGGWAVDDLDDPTSRHELSADGALGEEYRAMKAAKAKARSPVRDPYHNAVEEPVASREPPKESFRLMVVGEAGLGKTTLLESFFKSFKDDEALFALFERKETQTVIETRRQLDDAAARRAVCEREMKVAAEKMEYAKAEAKKAEIARLDNESAQLATQLKRLESADERRRNELRLLRERARNVRMEMKRAADAQQYGAAAEKRLQAELLQEEVAALQAELKQMRRVEGEAYPVDEEHERSSAVLHSSTVRPRPPHTPPPPRPPPSPPTPPARPLSGADHAVRPVRDHGGEARAPGPAPRHPRVRRLPPRRGVVRCDLRVRRGSVREAGGDGGWPGGARPGEAAP